MRIRDLEREGGPFYTWESSVIRVQIIVHSPVPPFTLYMGMREEVVE